MTIGVGAGQMSRINSARIAGIKAEHAGLEVKGSVMASDAFFPFRDGIDDLRCDHASRRVVRRAEIEGYRPVGQEGVDGFDRGDPVRKPGRTRGHLDGLHPIGVGIIHHDDIEIRLRLPRENRRGALELGAQCRITSSLWRRRWPWPSGPWPLFSPPRFGNF